MLICCKQKKDSDNDLESPINFREGLLKDLKRPYDQEELLKLLEDWSNQRPARGHAKNLRSGVIKTYALKGEYGKPYSILYEGLFFFFLHDQSSCNSHVWYSILAIVIYFCIKF